MRTMIDGKRYDLVGMTRLPYSTAERRGVMTKDVWYGPRSHRLIWHTYSIWDRGDGCHVGHIYYVFAPGDEVYGHMVEALERAGCTLTGAPVELVRET